VQRVSYQIILAASSLAFLFMIISSFSCNFVKVTQDNAPPFFFGIWKVEGFLSGELGNSNECLAWTDTIWYDDGDIKAAKSYSVLAMTVGTILWLAILATICREPGTVYQMIVASTCFFCAVMGALFFQVLGSDVCHLDGVTCRFGAAAWTSLLALALWTWTCFTFLNLVLESIEDDVTASAASSTSLEPGSKRRATNPTGTAKIQENDRPPHNIGDEEEGTVEMEEPMMETPLSIWAPPADANSKHIPEGDAAANPKAKRKRKSKRRAEATPRTEYNEESTAKVTDKTLPNTPQNTGMSDSTRDEEHGTATRRDEILSNSPPSPPFRVFVDSDGDDGKPIRKEPIRSILKNKAAKYKPKALATASTDEEEPVAAKKGIESLPDSPSSPSLRLFLEEDEERNKANIRRSKTPPKAEASVSSSASDIGQGTSKDKDKEETPSSPVRREALQYIMSLKQKRRDSADGREQRAWKTKEESSAPGKTEEQVTSIAKDAEKGSSNKLDEEQRSSKEEETEEQGPAKVQGGAKEPAEELDDAPSFGAPLVCVYTDEEGKLIKTTIRLFKDDDGQSVIEKTIEKLDQSDDASSSSSDDSASIEKGVHKSKKRKKKRAVSM
jgi:hypothetical protein